MEKYKSHTDLDLVAIYQEKEDLEALGVLYQRYTAMIYGVCLKYFKNTAEAEDAAMDIFEIIMRRLKGKTIERFAPWLYTLVKNNCLEKLRSSQGKRTAKKTADFMYSEEVYHLDSIKDDSQLAKLAICMEGLKQLQKDCVSLFYLQGQNYDQISVQLDLEWNKVRSNIQNGRRNLRQCMEHKK